MIELQSNKTDTTSTLVKSDIFLKEENGKKLFVKRYKKGKEYFYNKEWDFNKLVERTGYIHKPTIISKNDKKLEIVMDYYESNHLEKEIIEKPILDYKKLIDILLEEARHLKQINLKKLNLPDNSYSYVPCLLDHPEISRMEKKKIEEILEYADQETSVVRFDSEASNILVTKEGDFKTIDYSLPYSAHPVHNITYLLFNYNLPREKKFYNFSNAAFKQTYNEFMNRLQEFIPDEAQVESTIKGSLLNFFADDWMPSKELKELTITNPEKIIMNPTYKKRIDIVKAIINESYDKILKGDINFRRY